MKNRRYRQLLLFLVALLLPSLAIARLGWRVMTQEEELAVSRFYDERRQSAAGVGLAILTTLELIRFTTDVTASPRGAVVLATWADPGRGLVLPWEDNANAQRFIASQREPEFSRRMAEAATAWDEKNSERAAVLYDEAIRAARDDGQRAYARLLQARTLRLSGDPAGALRIYRDLLNLPSTVVDGDRIPFAYFSGKALTQARTAERDILTRVERDLGSPAVLTPEATGSWIEILGDLHESRDGAIQEKAAILSDRLSMRKAYLEQASKFQKAFSKLGATPAIWQHYDGAGETWLVGISANEARPLVIVVRSEDIFRRVAADPRMSKHRPYRIVKGTDAGEPLNDRLPGLRLVYSQNIFTEQGAGLRQSFYSLSFVLVLGLTFLAGFLLWRDTRRETRMAELRSQFVSSVSHELKTPLTSIRMFAELLQMRGSGSRKDQDDYLDTIVNESERLTRLLTNVLDFSRIEHGQKTYRMETTRLAEVVNAAARTMEYPLAEQGFDLKVHIDGDVPPIEVDRDAIKQAILNLLTNAMKYSGQSRGIELRLCPENGNAVIEVSDHGIGIPVQEQSKIFDKFYRARVPENQAISGTGLGLALVAHIAEAHHGSVHVKSSPGEGSTFSIHIPLQAGGHS
jgi:signal transduction histidine kinase